MKRKWDSNRGFVLGDEYPCPECGENTLIGFYYRTPDRDTHQHTRYICTSWPHPGHRCGWEGWTVLEAPSARQKELARRERAIGRWVLDCVVKSPQNSDRKWVTMPDGNSTTHVHVVVGCALQAGAEALAAGEPTEAPNEHESDQSRYASECDLCETDGHLHGYWCPNNPLRPTEAPTPTEPPTLHDIKLGLIALIGQESFDLLTDVEVGIAAVVYQRMLPRAVSSPTDGQQ